MLLVTMMDVYFLCVVSYPIPYLFENEFENIQLGGFSNICLAPMQWMPARRDIFELLLSK